MKWIDLMNAAVEEGMDEIKLRVNQQAIKLK